MTTTTFHPLARRLLDAATPFLRIHGVTRCDWKRKMKKPTDPRIGPWRYSAKYDVIDDAAWNTRGEVLYLVTSAAGELKLVGESTNRLKDRWRKAPMYSVSSGEPLNDWSLFHSSAWKHIEKGLDQSPSVAFTVSAIFQPRLSEVCAQAGLQRTLERAQAHGKSVAYEVETFLCEAPEHGPTLWNVNKNPWARRAGR